MSGEGDGYDRKITKNFDSEQLGLLENQSAQYGKQQRTAVYGEDADGFDVAPIQTKMKTSYIRSRDDQHDDWFNEVPKPQQYQTFQPAVMSRKAFGPLVEKPSIDQFRSIMLTEHNNYRVRHGVNLLKLNDVLNQQAQNWADYLAEYNFLNHSDDNDYGENLYTINLPNPNMYPTAEEVCDSWYNEIKDYEFGRDPPDSTTVEHFTQMVWRISTELGVGLAKAGDGAVYVVAKYNPRGNIADQYASNVAATPQ